MMLLSSWYVIYWGYNIVFCFDDMIVFNIGFLVVFYFWYWIRVGDWC